LLHILEAPDPNFDGAIFVIGLNFYVISIISSTDIVFEPQYIGHDPFLSNLKLLCSCRVYNTYAAEKHL